MRSIQVSSIFGLLLADRNYKKLKTAHPLINAL